MPKIPKTTKNKLYYNKHKKDYQKGGKYYTYVPKSSRSSKPIRIERGNFTLCFN